MDSEIRNCQSCKADFAIEPDDFAFYEKMAVPPPTFCPECRLIRRFNFRNERTLYKRSCELCGQEKIMMYPGDAPFPVYCRECWWSDKWDPKSYGREYDMSKPFFAQFAELFRVVPRAGMVHQGNIVDSDYTNRVTDARSCYLIFGTTRAEYCSYGTWFNDSKECQDCYSVEKSERCYECIDCLQCYNLAYSQECSSCTDSWLLYDCANCQNCFGCVNLRNKQYCIFNKQYSREEYQKMIAQFGLGGRIILDGLKAKFEELKRKCIVPALVTHHSVNASGNWIESAKNAHHCFNCRNVEDIRHCFSVFNVKDVMDYSYWGNVSERVYEAVNVGIQATGIKFVNESWISLRDIEYSMNIQQGSHDIFGSIGLRNSEYCILNKQYSKEEYEALVPGIKDQMNALPYVDSKGREYRYGEFFPIELSPHAYNETLAQEFFPITKAEALEKGYRWRDPEIKEYKPTLAADQLPDNVANAEDSITKEVIECGHKGECNQQCTRAFRILPEDLRMHKRALLPLPVLCPNCRHYERLAKRNPIRLWPRACACAGSSSQNGIYKNSASQHAPHGSGEPCPNQFQTSHAPGGPEIVYCEQCYQQEIA